MTIFPWRGGGGGGGHSAVLVLLLQLLMLMLHLTPIAAQVGYGPGFNVCGDSCQTSLRLFCTEGRNAQEQSSCWCGATAADVSEYSSRLAACLATCDPAGVGRQAELMHRYKTIVCAGDASGDPEFEEYYRERYGEFTPEATNAVPPPPLMMETATAVVTVTTSTASTRLSTLSTRTRTRTRATTRSTTSSTLKATRRISRTSDAATTSASSNSSTTTTLTSTPTPSASTPPIVAPISTPPLSSGAIAGIASGALLALVLLLLIGAYLARRRHASAASSQVPCAPSPAGLISGPLASSDTTWPPPSALQRRVSVYYSPDDITAAAVAIPAVRVTAPSPSLSGRSQRSRHTSGARNSAATEFEEDWSGGDGDDGSSEWTDDDRHHVDSTTSSASGSASASDCESTSAGGGEENRFWDVDLQERPEMPQAGPSERGAGYSYAGRWAT